MLKNKGTVYFARLFGNGIWYDAQRWGEGTSYQSEEEARAYIESYCGFVRYISKKEYETWHLDAATERMKRAIESNDFEKIGGFISNNENAFSIKALAEITGIKLSKTKKERMTQVREYFGESWAAWEKQQEQARIEAEETQKLQEKQQKELKLRDIMRRFNDNEFINGSEFVDLCDSKGLKMHIRTRGFCLRSLDVIKKDGHCWSRTGRCSDKVWELVDELRKLTT